MSTGRDRYRLAGALVALALVATACTAASGTTHSDRPAGSKPTTASPASSDFTTPPSWARTSPAHVRTTGELMQRDIPGGASHFAARDAEIYLPPAALDDPRLRLPVLELLHGTPGGPFDWLDPNGGRLLPTLEAFARAHRGRAPIVVMPDINGSHTADTECIRTGSGADVEQYLADIVPAWIAAHLPATTNHRDWAISGLSEGGTCALMLTLRHATTFTTIGDFSGLAHLTLGDGDQRARTIRGLFGGSEQNYLRHDPIWLLAHAATLRGVNLWMQCGSKEKLESVDQRAVAAKAAARGATVRSVLYPGRRHEWLVWANAITRMLPWWWNRISA